MDTKKLHKVTEIFYKIYMEQKISFEDFVFIRDYIHKISGIFLDYEKEYLIRQRIEPILKDVKVESFAEFSNIIKDGRSLRFKESIISAITTNETSFFRDDHPFKTFYKYIIPKLIDKIRRNKENKDKAPTKIRIWSAACSTGQEAYSISMLIDEYLYKNGIFNITKKDFYILATDIDTPVLKAAMTGCYDKMAISRGISDDRLKKYFVGSENKWEIKNELKEMVDFQKCSLHEGISNARFGGTFDVILARNVLIYFDTKTKDEILSRIHQLMLEDSFLILGATENLYGLSNKFESVTFENSLLFKKKEISYKPVIKKF